ncbi:MAG: flagellar biosynthetic protein FliQ [Myxococcota bacterium]
MTSTAALQWFRDMLFAAVVAASPAVLSVVIVGLIMAILQAATQVNDQAVAFGPKAIAVIVALSLGGAFTLETAADFTSSAIRAIADVTPR